MKLQNDNVYIKLDDEGIFLRDSTDFYNETSAYSLSKRGVNKVKEIIAQQFNNNTKFKDITELMGSNDIKYRIYCAVD